MNELEEYIAAHVEDKPPSSSKLFKLDKSVVKMVLESDASGEVISGFLLEKHGMTVAKDSVNNWRTKWSNNPMVEEWLSRD